MAEKVVIGNAELWHGDCREILPTLPQVSAVVTDPPYGLSFMGKRWDYDVPATDLWALVLERLLPGGHLLAFAGTRTQHRMAVRIEDAGFEIRDMIAWVYGSGFPKSHNGPWGGTALKPALEPITVARKPLVGTVEANWQEHGTGGLSVDACRVAHDEPCRMMAPSQANIDNPSEKYRQAGRRTAVLELKPEGRWPANLIHDGSDEVVSLLPRSSTTGTRTERSQEAEVSGTKWLSKNHKSREYTDIGSAARFFYCAKTSKSDRGEGNDHPTVKPTALMRYLCRLITPPDGIILDPFMGSGSTGKAAMLEGFRFIGIERDEKYFQIACERIARAQEQGQLIPHDMEQPKQETTR